MVLHSIFTCIVLFAELELISFIIQIMKNEAYQVLS